LLFQTTPTSEEIGRCDEIKVSEIGGTSVTIFKQGEEREGFEVFCSKPPSQPASNLSFEQQFGRSRGLLDLVVWEKKKKVARAISHPGDSCRGLTAL